MIVYIVSPYRAENDEQFQKQLAYTKYLARNEVEKGNDVIVPHLYYPRFLDDNNKDERELGLLSARNLLFCVDEVLIGLKMGLSSGMKVEWNLTKTLNKPIRLNQELVLVRPFVVKTVGDIIVYQGNYAECKKYTLEDAKLLAIFVNTKYKSNAEQYDIGVDATSREVSLLLDGSRLC